MKLGYSFLKYGIITGVFLIGYFYLLAIGGYIQSTEFSLFNIGICAIGIFLSISERREFEQSNYKIGFRTGLFTGLTATFLFTVFFAFYIQANPMIGYELLSKFNFSSDDIPLLIALVFALGILTIYLTSFLIAQLLFKKKERRLLK